jgi:hypothetical protein
MELRDMAIHYDTIWIVFVALFLAGALIRWQLVKRLQLRHASTWSSLGSPTLWNSNLSRLRRELAFLFTLQFRSLDDPGLTALAVVMLVLGVMMWALFLVLVGLIFGLIH